MWRTRIFHEILSLPLSSCLASKSSNHNVLLPLGGRDYVANYFSSTPPWLSQRGYGIWSRCTQGDFNIPFYHLLKGSCSGCMPYKGQTPACAMAVLSPGARVPLPSCLMRLLKEVVSLHKKENPEQKQGLGGHKSQGEQ